ncbi:hypothetical protein ACAX43_12480 [Paraburkholderia sp. IW21]|uniref:hypothetical protein n=1 Tax=Paraburkholderia sp. IW21 TaxID=3242488 RepID=UPI003521D29C
MKHTDNEKDPQVAGEHLVSESSKFAEYYPDHPPRTESALFRKTKKHWHELGTECYINHDCKGGIEIHHRYVEWAFAGAVDWNLMRELHPDFDWSTFNDATDFVDSIYNTLPLCEAHHRDPQCGVHHVPAPNWEIQRYVRGDYKLFPDKDNNGRP